MRTALIDLIIMQISLVPDSVTPATVLVRYLDRTPFSNMADARKF